MNELKNRGVDDILIAVVDGLKGFPEARRPHLPILVQDAVCDLATIFLLARRRSSSFEMRAIKRCFGGTQSWHGSHQALAGPSCDQQRDFAPS